MQVKLVNQNRSVTLAPLAAGGEGTVYEIQGDPSAVAKVYHKPDPQKMDKIRHMFGMGPYPPGQPLPSHIEIAWPLDVIEYISGQQQPSQQVAFTQGQRVGFAMPRMRSGMETVAEVFNPRDRKKKFPNFTWAYMHRVATNIATIMHRVHSTGSIALGDINESNVMVANDAMITIIDCDSAQVGPFPSIGGGTIVNFRCPVGKGEYTPPELQFIFVSMPQGTPIPSFRNVDRKVEHDRFGLGVLVWQLLMEGTHPFDGIYTGSQDPPPLREDAIREGNFMHDGATVPYQTRPTDMPFKVLHPNLQRLFIRCFQDGHNDPSVRPTAEEWALELEIVEQGLTTCTANSQHKFSPHVATCPWCERKSKFKIDAYPRRVPTTRPMTGGGGPSTVVVPTATVVAPPMRIVLPVTSVAFSATRVGTTPATGTFTIQNSGTGDLHLTSVSVVSGPFVVQPLTSTTVAPGGSVTVNLTFSPTARGAVSGSVEVRSDDPTHGTLTVALTGLGLAPEMVVSWPGQPGALDCGQVRVGSASAPRSITITNQGDTDLGNISITAPANITVGQYAQTLAAGDAQAIELTLTPASEGIVNDQITIKSDDPVLSSLTLNITAEGISPTVVTPRKFKLGGGLAEISVEVVDDLPKGPISVRCNNPWVTVAQIQRTTEKSFSGRLMARYRSPKGPCTLTITSGGRELGRATIEIE